jgi:hypothetical protein
MFKVEIIFFRSKFGENSPVKETPPLSPHVVKETPP